MAFVAGEHFRAAAEAEPAIGFAVVGAAAVSGQGLACGDAEGVFGPFTHGGAVCCGAVCGGYEEEFDFGDFEGCDAFRQMGGWCRAWNGGSQLILR